MSLQPLNNDASADKLASVSRTGHVTFLRVVACNFGISADGDNRIRTPGSLEPENVVPIRPHCGSDPNKKPITVLLDTRGPIRPAHVQADAVAMNTLVRAHSPSKVEQQQLLSTSASDAAQAQPKPTSLSTQQRALLAAAPPSSVPSAPVLDLDVVDSYAPSSVGAAPTTRQLQHQLDFGLSASEAPKLAAPAAELNPEIPIAGLTESSHSEQPSPSALTGVSRSRETVTADSSQGSTESVVDVHLLDGIHVAIPQDSAAHKLTQAYTKTEKPVHDSIGDTGVLEVRQVWEERVDDGDWQVVKEETSRVECCPKQLDT